MPCGGCGPGYASPAEAMEGPREKILFTTCVHAADGHDMLAGVDVDPNSPTYCTVVSRADMPNKGDEIHHSGWNACSSCHGKKESKRSHLVLPALNSSRIYIINVENERNIFLEKTIESSELEKFDVSFPHTSHCLADGNIMISTLGDKNNKQKGDFLLLDGKTFEPKGTWPVSNTNIAFNYDFWYQPRQDVMISTEWGSPHVIKGGFNPAHVAEGHYGHSLHVFRWSTHEHLQTIVLPEDKGAIPLEVRFKHNPDSTDAFVGVGLGSTIYYVHPKAEGSMEYEAECVVTIPPKEVSGWALPVMDGLVTDIILSMDDRYLYLSCWLHGDIRQYDISDPKNPKLTGQVFVGGSIHTESGVTVTKDEEMTAPPPAAYIKGKRIEGGPQMLQMSLDGKRLYVTTSLYKKWDEQFYPQLLKGAMMLRINCGPDGISLDEDFLVDFANVEGGPYLCHEMRYPGGDCTSDIWL